MLVSVKFYKIFLVSLFLLFSFNISADEKTKIVSQLKSLNSLEFTFYQTINDKTEQGSCLLKFPGKLKCEYFDDKDKLLEIVKSGKIELSDKIIKLVYLDDNEITVFFDKKTLDLKGWQIIDQYNNNINFSLNIVAKNDVFKKGTFKIPEMN